MKTFIITITILFLTCVTYADIIYVDDSNTSGIENGSLQYPFNTVTEGIDAAGAGDTVYIFSGAYFIDETFPIYLKAGITLLGENRDLTVIQDSLALLVTSESEPVFIHNLTFERIKITRSSPGTIPQLPNLIKNCSINEDVEIAYYGIHRFSIESCSIGGGVGFNIARDSLNRTSEEYNTIYNCEIDSSFLCEFTGNHKFIIQGCTIGLEVAFACSIDSIFTDPDIFITDNLIGGYLSIYGVRTATMISGNTVNEGILLTISGHGKSQNILNNEITSSSSTLDGIYLKLASSPALVENNEINLTQNFTGLYIKSSDTVVVKGNIIHGGRAGFEFIGSKGSVLGNTITESDTGMMLLSSHLLCNENSISNCSNAGIISEGTGSFNYNTITNCSTGIIESAGDFYHNTVSDCTGDGIISTISGVFGNNKISNNQGAGIRIQNFADIGGGPFDSPGNNILQGNGNYDLLIESTLDSLIYAKHNLWDHIIENEISQFDIYDKNDDTTLALVIFTPFLLTDVKENTGKDLPTDFVLYQNYPNPFNPSTCIKFTVAFVGTSYMKFIQLKVYDVLGNEVTTLLNEELSAGEYEVELNSMGLTSGIYFYQLKTENYIETKKMVLMK